MIKVIPTLSAILLTTILLTGTVSPYSFATNYDDDDEFSDENCGCEKPSKFTVEYHGDSNVDIEVYKNYGQWRNDKAPIHVFTGVNDGAELTIDSQIHMNGKEKLSSNLVYNVINGPDSKHNSIGITKIHISCSEPLFIGQVHTARNNENITFTVLEGLDDDGDYSVFEDYICPINETPDNLSCNGNLVNFYTLEHGAMQGDASEPAQGTINSYLNSIDGSAENGDITLSVDNNNNNHPDEGTIYDSDVYPVGADPDLQNVEDKKILIIAENNVDSDGNGLIDNPDDEAAGGKMTISFDIPQTVQSLLWVDLDDGESVTITATDVDGATTVELVGDDGPTGNGMSTPVLFPEGTENIVELEFTLTSSGGMTDLCIQETPVQTGTIKIIKETDPSPFVGTLFNFTTDGEELSDFMLDTDPDTVDVSNTEMFSDIKAGEITRTIEETLDDPEAFDTTVYCNSSMENSEFSTLDEKITITKLGAGDTLTCTYTNVEVVPPTGTLTLFKSVTSDNGVMIPDDSEFGLSVTGVSNPQFATQMTVNANVPITIQIGEPDDYDRVILAGDNCPAVSEFETDDSAEIMLSDGEDRICTFYYDDEFQETSGGQGIIFHRNSLDVQTDGIGNLIGGDLCGDPTSAPCFDVPPPFLFFNQFLVNDTAITSETAVVAITVVPDSSQGGATSLAQCQVDSIVDISPTKPENRAFAFTCPTFDSGAYKFNYALIETME